MEYRLIVVLCSIALWSCASSEFLCQSYDENTKSFEYYCEHFTKFRGKTPVNCSGEENSAESNEAVHLTIGGCRMHFVADFVEHSTAVRTLNVSFSRCKTLDSLPFQHNQMETVNISHNALTEYPWKAYLDFLDRFPSLTELDLSFNKIRAIHTFVNRTVIKLKRLHLQNNSIAFIQSKAFENLTNLDYLDLSNNKLTQVSPNAYSNLKHLGTLDLRNNPIEFFFCEDLLKMKVVWVHVSWDRIEHFNSDCDGIGSFVTHPNDWLSKHFIVAFNTSKQGFFSYHADGQYKIDCNDTSFENISTFKAGHERFAIVLDILQCFGTKLIELDLSGNFIGMLNSMTFERFVNLQELSLSNTQLLKFDFQMLQHQKQLISLDISDNGLEDMDSIALSWNLRDLHEFRAGGNRFHSDLIQRLPSTIKYLDLSDSYLGKLTPRSFQYLTNLEELELKNTRLVTFDNNPFEALDHLYLLDVSGNNLYETDFVILAPTLNKLREFRAVACNIQMAADVIQYVGTNLWTLDLSGNVLGDFNADSPLQRLNLINLHLNNANITTFDLNVLKESTNLAHLEIANNQLKEIDLTPVSIDLLVLNLEGNELSVVSDLTPQHFPKIQSLNMAHNQLSCESLEHIQSEWNGKVAELNLQNQKHGIDCAELAANTTEMAKTTAAPSS